MGLGRLLSLGDHGRTATVRCRGGLGNGGLFCVVHGLLRGAAGGPEWVGELWGSRMNLVILHLKDLVVAHHTDLPVPVRVRRKGRQIVLLTREHRATPVRSGAGVFPSFAPSHDPPPCGCDQCFVTLVGFTEGKAVALPLTP